MKYKLMIFFLLSVLLLLVGCNKKEFTIRFVDYDDSVIYETTLKEGKEITPPSNPSRVGYTFIGWDKEFSIAKEDLVIKAMYEVKKLKVTFRGFEKEVLKEEEVEYNKDATAPNVTPPEGYRFIGWDREFTNVKVDMVIIAKFEKLSYWVRFYDPNGLLLKEEQVEYGSSATAPNPPTLEGLEFSHWDKDFSQIKSDTDIYAVYNPLRYKIEFYDGNNKLSLGMDTYKPIEETSLPIPTKEGYAFVGWFLSDISLYEISKIEKSFSYDLKLYSRWIKLDLDLPIPTNATEFSSITRIAHSSGKGYVYQPQFPAGTTNTSRTAYTWTSSDTKVVTISAYSSISVVSPGFAIITATLNSNPSVVYYCIVHATVDGVRKVTLDEISGDNFVKARFMISETEIVEKITIKGGSVVPPTPPKKEGYIFTGWVGQDNEKIYNITKDTIYLPTYVEGKTSYAGKTVSILGDSISTFYSYMPSTFAHFYPYPTADIFDVNQTWWMQFINHYGMKLLANNSWGGSAVAGDAESATRKKTRLQHLFIGDVKPDVIIIFMGNNDAASQYINLTMFDNAYDEMLKNIKSMSPDSEIILCTLPPLELFSSTDQVNYNQVIRKYANNYGYKLIEFSTAYERQENQNILVDSAHPNNLGMDMLAQKAINDFFNYIK